jgi:hypothetical protein
VAFTLTERAAKEMNEHIRLKTATILGQEACVRLGDMYGWN